MFVKRQNITQREQKINPTKGRPKSQHPKHQIEDNSAKVNKQLFRRGALA
jgi:hypothetical protein